MSGSKCTLYEMAIMVQGQKKLESFEGRRVGEKETVAFTYKNEVCQL
jgi:hypothetical protein